MANIGLYAGSFNPFHKGHLNILLKAERIFDRVIVGRGKNKSKADDFLYPMPKLDGRQVVEYKGLITKFIDTLPYDVTLIRGLRNSTDLQAELTFYRYLQYLKPDIKVVSIFCDSEYEHISSSGIKELLSEDRGHDLIV